MQKTAAAAGHGATIPSLDGLRAIAVLVVCMGHAGKAYKVIPGGFGVTVFFFLSGFLITTLFTREWARYGKIAIPAFYLRRLLRLSPPLLITMGLTYTLVALGLVQGEIKPSIILSQLLYYYNYYSAFVAHTAEGAVGFNILWSLSVEEHFYLLYPLVFLGFAKGRVKIVHIVVALAAFCAWRLVNWYVFHVPADSIYIRSDTRFDSILWGSLLALLRWKGIAQRLFPEGASARYGILALSGAVLLACFVVRGDAFRETLRYSLQGMALLPVFHYAVNHPDLPLFRPLNWTVARKIGEWSYSIYLIHYVILGALRFHNFPLQSPLAVFPLMFGASVLYAALMSYVVERPIKGLRAKLSGHATA